MHYSRMAVSTAYVKWLCHQPPRFELEQIYLTRRRSGWVLRVLKNVQNILWVVSATLDDFLPESDSAGAMDISPISSDFNFFSKPSCSDKKEASKFIRESVNFEEEGKGF